MSKRVLISGGGGYLGFRTALKYLQDSDARVVLTVHAKDQDELAHKSEPLLQAAGQYADRVEPVRFELEEEEPLRELDPSSIDEIIHSAAVTRFNVEADVAQTVNINGTEKVMKFASQCPRLQSFGLLSSIYASGLRKGEILETRLNDSEGFANHYELSKWSGEELLFKKYESLPWKVFRIATVLADRDDGLTIQQNAVHNTLKLFYYGLISLIPGSPETPVYLVNGDFVAQSVFEGMQSFPQKQIYHVCHAREHSIQLGELIDLAYETYLKDPAFKSRRLLKPLFADAQSFHALVKGATEFGGNVLSQAVSSIAPFGVQLFITKDVKNNELVSRLSHYAPPNPQEHARNTCQFLVESKFKKLSLTDIVGGAQ
ncbi:MAG: SDR family oxidoreductase [Bdellovibrionia bacterium]